MGHFVTSLLLSDSNVFTLCFCLESSVADDKSGTSLVVVPWSVCFSCPFLCPIQWAALRMFSLLLAFWNFTMSCLNRGLFFHLFWSLVIGLFELEHSYLSSTLGNYFLLFIEIFLSSTSLTSFSRIPVNHILSILRLLNLLSYIILPPCFFIYFNSRVNEHLTL